MKNQHFYNMQNNSDRRFKWNKMKRDESACVCMNRKKKSKLRHKIQRINSKCTQTKELERRRETLFQTNFQQLMHKHTHNSIWRFYSEQTMITEPKKNNCVI